MSAKRLKPRQMWANYYPAGSVDAFHNKQTARNNVYFGICKAEAIPVAVIPLDDVEALVEEAYQAFLSNSIPNDGTMKGGIRAALTAIGVLPKHKKKAKPARPRHAVEFENAEQGDEG